MKLRFCLLCLVLMLVQIGFAQTSTLTLNNAIDAELGAENSSRFTIQLAANQTARIEVEYLGSEVSLIAYDRSGESFITVASPSGSIGNRVLLLTTSGSGVYTVEVARTQAIPTKYRINLTEIRATNPHDLLINETRAKINQLVLATPGDPGANQTISEQRKTIEIRREIINLSKIIDDKHLEARSLILVGARHQSLGDMQSALDAWIEARKIFREIKRPDLEGLPVLTIGTIYLTIAEYDRALEYFTEAERLLSEGGPVIKAAIYGLYASALYPKDQHQKAIEFADRSLAIYSEYNLKLGEMTIYGLLGTIYQDANLPRAAIQNLEKALIIADDLEQNGQGVADLKIRLGILYFEAGRKKEAFELLVRGKEIAELVGQRHLVISALYHLAVAENDSGNLAGAIKRVEEAIELIEQIRMGLQDKSQRASYFSTVQDSYELYTDLLIKRSTLNKDPTDISRAFEISERSRARSLIDLFEDARIEFRQGVDRELLDREIDLLKQLDAARQARKSLPETEPKPIAEMDAVIDRLAEETAAIKSRIERESPRYSNLTRGATLSTKEVQQLLDNETVLLEFKLGRERSFVWFISNRSVRLFELPNRKEIEDKVRQFYELTVANQKVDSAKAQKLSIELHSILLSQVSKEIEGKRIAIVAEGILQYLPFSALKLDDRNYLADRHEIIILPSASVLAELRLTPESEHDRVVAVFADPVFDRGDSRLVKGSTPGVESGDLVSRLRDFGDTLPRLLASRQEARNIADLVGQSEKVLIKTDFEASVLNIKNADLNGYRILHFATHGLLNTAKPELSGLVFSLFDETGKPQNGFLDLNDIFNLKISSDLVVLSACQTALGKDVRGEGLIGISRGFLYAGSKRVVASLWKVDDSATAEFMKLFYANLLQKGMPASAALRTAKLEMKEIPRYRSPYYWSAFTILGDWQ